MPGAPVYIPQPVPLISQQAPMPTPMPKPLPVLPAQLADSSQYESSWRSKFPKMPCFVLSIVQIVLIFLIFTLEVASLSATSGLRPTGVGIWCAIPFTIASVLTFLLGNFILLG